MQKKTIKDATNDVNISATTLGIYLYLLLEMPDNISKELVEDRFANASIKISTNAVDKAFSELTNNGYMELKTITQINEKGQILFNGKKYFLNK